MGYWLQRKKYRSKVENNVIHGHVKISIKTHGFHENVSAYKRKDIILVYYISSLYMYVPFIKSW